MARAAVRRTGSAAAGGRVLRVCAPRREITVEETNSTFDGGMMSRQSVRRIFLFACALAAAAASGAARALEWNLQPAASAMSADIHSLHEYVMILVTVIFVGVFGFMFYACWAHRKSKGHPAAQFHENTTVELIWTIIPAIIL